MQHLTPAPQSAASYAQELGAAAEEEEAAAAAGFDGLALANLVERKWGVAFDMELTQTDYLGKASVRRSS